MPPKKKKDVFGKCPKCGKYNGEGYYLPGISRLCYECEPENKKRFRDDMAIAAEYLLRKFRQWVRGGR